MQVPAGHPEKPQGEDGLKLLDRMNGGHHEELANWGLSHLDVRETDDVLDIGCGGGANIERLLARATKGHVTGVDYSPLSVKASRAHNERAIAEGRCEVLEGNSSALPFGDDSFDVATAFETTYYWDLPVAFREVNRVLRPGGLFLVCNEDNGEDPGALELAEQIPNMSVHTVRELEEALEAAGFEIVTCGEVREKGHMAIVSRRPGI